MNSITAAAAALAFLVEITFEFCTSNPKFKRKRRHIYEQL